VLAFAYLQPEVIVQWALGLVWFYCNLHYISSISILEEVIANTI